VTPEAVLAAVAVAVALVAVILWWHARLQASLVVAEAEAIVGG
jgi:hypothetical protein